MTQNPLLLRAAERGFTLVEMIVVVFLLAIAMLGLLAVFDASARINKNEQQLADAQGNVRYGIYQMTRAIRDAGTGGLYVTQAVLNAPDPNLPGITVGSANGYDNVTGATVRDNEATPRNIPVRPGTDMIEVRGVINTPLISLDGNGDGCGGCTGAAPLTAKAGTFTPFVRPHINDDAANRPQFSLIDTYTQSASADGTANRGPMFVIVSGNDNLHGCTGPPSALIPYPPPRYPQPNYNVGRIVAQTTLGGVPTPSFGSVDFAYANAVELNSENPQVLGTPATAINVPRRAGILDDLLYFIDDTDPLHPALAQGTRRGASFSVVTLAEDVEDMQVAYGVDVTRPGGGAADNVVGRTTVPPYPPSDPDNNVSTLLGQDEWLPNVSADTNPVTGTAVYGFSDFVANAPSADASTHCPQFHAVMIALLARSKDPDPTYRSPAAYGFKIMNTAIAPVAGQYRRRIQTLKINLRNYAFTG